MKVTSATLEDIPELLDLCRQFLEESNWGWTFNEDNAIKSFYTNIVLPDCDILQIKNDDGELLGCVMVSIENDFQTENVGDIQEFYIRPEARGTGAGRELLKAACEWFDENKCVRVFVKATANIGKDAAFVNLFKKYDFEVFSVVLVR